MENITPQQKRKLEKIVKLAQNGNPAILEYLFELEEKLDTEIPKIADVISRLKGDKGDAYAITEEDKAEIASRAREMFKDEDLAEQVLALIDIPLDQIAKEASKLIVVPPPQKVDYTRIKKEVLADIVIQPGEKGKDADEVVIAEKVEKSLERNLPQFGEAFRDGLELLPNGQDGTEDLRLDKKAIRGLDDYEEISKLARAKSTTTVMGANRAFHQLLDVDFSGITDGQVPVYDASTQTWRPGEGGGGDGGSSSAYLFTQAVASSSWVVTHGLNDANPFVTVYSPTDEMVEPESITINSANQLTIVFGTAVSGIAKVLGNSVVTPTTSITAVTTSSTATGGDYIRADASAGNITITLITPVQGETVKVKKVDSSENSVYVYSTLLIDGDTTAELTQEGELLEFFYTGSTYDIN